MIISLTIRALTLRANIGSADAKFIQWRVERPGESRWQALAAAYPDNKRHAARVVGPSKFFEGQFIYHLIQWL